MGDTQGGNQIWLYLTIACCAVYRCARLIMGIDGRFDQKLDLPSTLDGNIKPVNDGQFVWGGLYVSSFSCYCPANHTGLI